MGRALQPRDTEIHGDYHQLSVLITRKSFSPWKEFFFADFFALFASWRLMRTALSPRRREKRKENAKNTVWLRLRRSVLLTIKSLITSSISRCRWSRARLWPRG